MFNVAVIVGSLRKESFNRKIAFALEKLQHPTFQLSHIKIDDIPLYNQDFDNNLPDSVVRFKKEITEADAVLFVTPEYNRSIPGVLKNIIDWGTRPYGKNVWAGKLMAAIGTSPGAIGTAVAQSHLRSIMVAIDGVYFGQPEIYLVYKDGLIDNNFSITIESTRNFLQGFLDRFAREIEKHKST
ncbi:TPA: NADPH-dependent FMN reductase [Legionella pneumophila]|nr:NADPH-dependent FMN reductase [Legionella pneumophila]HAT8182060.1 NADPH-dependent FMN reductase [Legionella pneumophila]